MNILAILRQSWHITWRSWRLWLITLAMLITFLPSLFLSMGFSSGSMLKVLSANNGRFPPTQFWLFNHPLDLPAWVWVLMGVGALILLVVMSAISWSLQAGTMRMAAAAAEGRVLPLVAGLRLGRRRFANIIKLSATFGLLISLLGFLPTIILFFQLEDPTSATGTASSVVSPVTTILSFVLLLVMMSIALEDVGTWGAFRRSWQVFRSEWWGFVRVYILSFVLGFVLLAIALPVPFILMLVIFSTIIKISPLLFWILMLPLLAISLFVLVFIVLFTLVLYTLVYQTASKAALGGVEQPVPVGVA